MSILFFDTETTGLPNKRLGDEMQPHIVQLAAFLTTPEGRVVSSLNHIIKPEGWDIPQESIDVHGITMDTALKYGLSRAAVLAMFSNLVKRADLLVAHNAQFDLKITNLQYKRQNTPSPLLGKEVFCTAANSVDLIKIPPTERMKEAGYGNCFKTPNLRELCEWLGTGWDETRGHDAAYDVEMCMWAYFRIKGWQKPEEKKTAIERHLSMYKLLHDWIKVDHPEFFLKLS